MNEITITLTGQEAQIWLKNRAELIIENEKRREEEIKERSKSQEICRNCLYCNNAMCKIRQIEVEPEFSCTWFIRKK